MIVKYMKERGYQGEGEDSSLTLDHFYIVLGVDFKPERQPPTVTLRREGDGTPCLFDLNLFEVVDAFVPNTWGFYDYGDGYYTLQPKEFDDSFWDDYHDGDSVADKLFEEVYARLVVEHPDFKAMRSANFSPRPYLSIEPNKYDDKSE